MLSAPVDARSSARQSARRDALLELVGGPVGLSRPASELDSLEKRRAHATLHEDGCIKGDKKAYEDDFGERCLAHQARQDEWSRWHYAARLNDARRDSIRADVDPSEWRYAHHVGALGLSVEGRYLSTCLGLELLDSPDARSVIS
jgi:hypothetical protein